MSVDPIVTPQNAGEFMRMWGGIESIPVNELQSGVKIGIYGPGGAGKTTLIGTACDSPHGGPILYLDARGNPHVIASRRDQVEVVPIDKFAQVEAVRKDIVKALNAGQFPFKSIALDNISDMVSMDLRDRYGTMANIEWTQHSATTADGLNLMRNFSDIADVYGINVFFVFWDVYETRTVRGQEVNRSELALNKALQSQVPGILNWLGRLYISGGPPTYTRCLDFRPIEKEQVSKWQIDPDDERTAGISMEIYNPSLGDILDTIKGGKPYPVDAHLQPGVKRG